MDIGNIVITIVSTLLILTGLIVAHEFGHYIVAKKRGIKVAEFAIGFGPKALQWGKGETKFSLRWILAGGYVRFADDVEEDPKPGDLRAASIKSRALTIVAGPVMNVIVAIILVIIMLMTSGDINFEIQNVVSGTPAYEAGLQDGDYVRRFNGVRLDFYYDWQDVLKKDLEDSVPLEIDSQGETKQIEVPKEDIQNFVEQNMTPTPRTFNFFEAVGLSFKWIFLQMREIVTTLGRLFFTFQGVDQMAGIVGTAAVVGTAVQTSMEMSLMLVALISINLAIINLLPIPALDGGKLLLYLIEFFRKKPISEKVEGIINLVGMAAIIGLAIFLVFQDVGRLLPAG